MQANSAQARKTLVYLVSPRYSGSTLLSFVIGFFPEISTIGERKKFYSKGIRPDGLENRCSCGKTFMECEKWAAIRKRFLTKEKGVEPTMNFTQFEWNKNRYVRAIINRSARLFISRNAPLRGLLRWLLGKTLRQNYHLIESILEEDENHLFFDSSKPLDHALFLSLLPQYNVKIIYLSRQPAAQISSALKYNDWTLARATKEWTRETKRNLATMERWKIEYYAITYEQFVTNYREELAHILKFIDPSIVYDGGDIDFRDVTQHIMGNKSMRMGSTSDIKVRDDWKKRLSEEDTAFIREKTATVQTKVLEHYAR